MSVADIPTISIFIRECLKDIFARDNVDSRIPGGIFFIHSVKSPLTALEINLGQLEKYIQSGDNQSALDHIKGAQNASQHIQKLVKHIPHQAKSGTALLADKVDILQAVQSLKILYSHKKNKNLIFNVNLKKNKTQIRLNQMYFFEMMMCLINNGFESYDKRYKPKLVIVTIVGKRNRINFQFQDFGQGINKIQLMLLTKSGFSTKKAGHGFGLWFVKKIVSDLLQRELKIISRVGEGTIIKFSVPVA
jgi:sensor histidine kinase regulating citrate/malate metabolism